MEQEHIETHVQRLAEGFGFGEGSISHAERAGAVGPEVMKIAEGVIESPEIIVPISKDKNGNLIKDDGCGDGRSTFNVSQNGEKKNVSLDRSKVFGGGSAMALASKIGLSEVADKPLTDAFKSSIEHLQDMGIDFGAHTDSHNHSGPNSGCGAIDKSPAVIANVVTNTDAIRATIANLGVDTTQLDEVLDNYSTYAANLDTTDYSGKNIVEKIADTGKIVKELDGDHQEAYVVLNTIEGHTVNQKAVRDATGDKVQVFGVDVWRMQELAGRMYPDQPEKANQAFLGQLAYTLGVSATLTAGDLPVYLVGQK